MRGTPTHEVKIALAKLGEHHGFFKRAETNPERYMPRPTLLDVND